MRIAQVVARLTHYNKMIELDNFTLLTSNGATVVRKFQFKTFLAAA